MRHRTAWVNLLAALCGVTLWALAAHGGAWASPASSPMGQTVPTRPPMPTSPPPPPPPPPGEPAPAGTVDADTEAPEPTAADIDAAPTFTPVTATQVAATATVTPTVLVTVTATSISLPTNTRAAASAAPTRTRTLTPTPVDIPGLYFGAASPTAPSLATIPPLNRDTVPDTPTLTPVALAATSRQSMEGPGGWTPAALIAISIGALGLVLGVAARHKRRLG